MKTNKSLDQKVVVDVNYCIDTLVSFLGIRKLEKIPEIKSSEEISKDDSGYNAEDGNLYIHPNDIGDGLVYFEEAMHFLRGQEVPKEDDDHIVQEFFGRLGESVGIECVQGTKYSYLVDGREPEHCSDLNFLKEICSLTFEYLNSYRKFIESSKMQIKNSLKLVGISKEYFSDLVDVVEKYPTEINEKEILNSIGQRTVKYLQWRKELGKSLLPKVIEDDNKFNDTIELLVDGMVDGLSSKSQHSEYEYQMFMTTNLKTIKGIIECYGVNINEARLKLESTIRKIDNYLHETEVHLVGYVAAEQFMEQNADFMLQVPNLFKMSNKDIFEKFINDESLKPYKDAMTQLKEEKSMIPLL